MKITRLISNLLQSNTYILEKGDEILIIDAGCETSRVMPYTKGKKVVAILLTHGHFDHSAYCNDYALAFGAPIYANKNIKETLTNPDAIYSEDKSTIDDLTKFIFVDEDEILNLGNFEVYCYHCSGHSKCSECYIIDGEFFAGDVLFEKSFGRVDLIGSDKKEMLESLNKIENLKFNNLYSGHGDESSFEEQQKNIKIFKRFLSR